MGSLKNEFANPGIGYRSAPFWSWNDKLSATELRRQARDMKAQGMGGFFMHSREGLETEYLGKDWWNCVRATVDEAKKIGMNAWLYDEDRWPSGHAGGLVPKHGDECKAKGLTMDIVKGAFKPTGGEQRIFLARLDGDKLVYAKQVVPVSGRMRNTAAHGEPVEPRAASSGMPILRQAQDERVACGRVVPAKGEVVLVFRIEISATSPWYNNGTYGDNLSPVSVRTFIETTYEPYKREVGREFGKTVPGMFTDEPHFAGFIPNRKGTRWIPWTTVFRDFFLKRRGYDPFDRMPHFFFDGAHSLKIRHDYWRTATELFADSFSRQLGQWCGRNGLVFSGHFLDEPILFEQIRVGGAVMPQYEHQHQPGIDILCDSISETLTVKQCSSAVNQFRRKRLLSELYGCTGWELSFEGQKWVGDWQYALGVNFRCQHLTLYTLRGCRKRDYPPSFNYQNTWWNLNGVIEDYFARLSRVLSEGRAGRDILVIHPISSAWATHDFRRDEKVNEIDANFKGLSDGLMSLHRDHDYGDETLIAKYAGVEGRKFRVAKALYDVVIVPPSVTLFPSTFGLLKKFVKAGGKLIAIKPVPTFVDALPSNELSRFFKSRGVTVIDRTNLPGTLDGMLPPRVRLIDKSGHETPRVLCMERVIGRDRFFFLANTDRNSGCEAEMLVPGGAGVEEWNALNGKITPVAVSKVDAAAGSEWLSFPVKMGPVGSRLYRVSAGGPKPGQVAADKPTRVTGVEFLGPVWDFKRLSANSLPLDFCEFSLDGSKFSPKMQVWQAQRDIRKKLGLVPVEMNGRCQRWVWLKDVKQPDKANAVFRFGFNVADVPATPSYLVVEGAKHFDVRLNGVKVSNRPAGWWIDKSFNKLRLPRLRKGRNVLTLSCRYRAEMEVEDCYIIGDFGVDGQTLEITTEPSKLHSGDWCFQRYPFYSGNMAYKYAQNVELKKGERAFMRLGKFEATVVSVKINGRPAGIIPWRDADGLEITKHVARPGKHVFEIEVRGSLRNSFGPLHFKGGKPGWTGCEHFRTEGAYVTPDYILFPYGLMGQVRIEKRV
jgi:hypothetical protein